MGRVEIEKLNESEGTIFTRTMLFKRPDLFEQCPVEVQEYIIFRHMAEKGLSVGAEEGRLLWGQALAALKIDKV